MMNYLMNNQFKDQMLEMKVKSDTYKTELLAIEIEPTTDVQ